MVTIVAPLSREVEDGFLTCSGNFSQAQCPRECVKAEAVDEDGHRVVLIRKRPITEKETRHDGRRAEDGTGGAAAQGGDGARRGLPAGGRAGAVAGADGDGGRGARGRRPARADRGAQRAAQRVPREGLGHAGGHDRAAGAPGAGRELLPVAAGAAQAGRAGAGGGGAGGLRPRGLDAAGRRPGEGARA